MSRGWWVWLASRGATSLGLALLLGTAHAEAGSVRERLRARVEAASAGAALVVGDDLVLASATLREFYERRSFEPAWSRNGVAEKAATALLGAIRAASAEGLQPEDYHLAAIRHRLRPSTGSGSVRM